MVTSAAVLLVLAVLVWPGRPGGDPADRWGPEAQPPRGTRVLAPRERGGHRRLGPAAWRVARSLADWRGRERGRAARGSPWVADFAEVVSVGLDAGLDLGSAALVSARSPGVLERAPWLLVRLQASVEAGRGVAGCLEPPRPAPEDDRRDLALLAAAWRLAEEVGAGAASVTAAAADAVRSRRAGEERAGVVAAGPRASMWLLTALPLAGPLAGALVGIGPDRLYGSAAGRGAAVAGLALTGAGWWWSRTILARARRPGRTSGELT